MAKRYTRIKGEDKPQNVIRLPRIGKIRLGIKKVSKSGKEYPTEVDYFVVPEEVQARYGKEPKILPVMIPVENEEMFLRQYYGCYGGNQKLKCQGDGETAARRDENGSIEEIKCPSPDNCDFGKKNKCSARTDMMFVLPDINCGACYQLSTGSINSDIDIRSGIEMAKYLFGRISWVPMEIRREEMKIPDPATGKMQTHWPVKLYPTASIAQTNAIRSDTKRILDRQQNFVLDEPVMEGVMTDTPIEVIDDEPETGTKGLPEGQAPASEPEAPPTEGGQREAKKEAPAAAQVAQTTDSGETANDTKPSAKKDPFLEAMAEQKTRVGEEAYYRVLGGHGYKKANEIIDRKKQVVVFYDLVAL